jgi:hypothetical protein
MLGPPERGDTPMETLLTLLTAWIASVQDLPPPPQPPRIAFVEAVRLAALDPAAAGRSVLGRYDTRDGTIYLTEGWNDRDFLDVSVLVHELVHGFQAAAGTTYPCPEAREALAYAVQGEWLALFGHDLETAFGIDATTLKLRTECLPW